MEKQCEIGSRVTIRVALDDFYEVMELKALKKWFMPGLTGKPCHVARIEGKLPVPPNCRAGKTLEVSGEVKHPPNEVLELMEVTSARCF